MVLFTGYRNDTSLNQCRKRVYKVNHVCGIAVSMRNLDLYSFMWIPVERRLLIFPYRCDQGLVCERDAREGAEQRFTKIISFSALSCQRHQPSLSQLGHVNSWFLTITTEVEVDSRLGARKCIWGQSRAAICFFTAGLNLFSTSSPSALGDSCPLSYFHTPLCGTLTRGFCPSLLHSVSCQLSWNITKVTEMFRMVAGPFKNANRKLNRFLPNSLN